MKLWIDAQLPPQLAPWLASAFGLDARAVRDLGLREAEDEPIFMAARREGAVVMTKDADFELLLSRFGPPPPDHLDHLRKHHQHAPARHPDPLAPGHHPAA